MRLLPLREISSTVTQPTCSSCDPLHPLRNAIHLSQRSVTRNTRPCPSLLRGSPVKRLMQFKDTAKHSTRLMSVVSTSRVAMTNPVRHSRHVLQFREASTIFSRKPRPNSLQLQSIFREHSASDYTNDVLGINRRRTTSRLGV